MRKLLYTMALLLFSNGAFAGHTISKIKHILIYEAGGTGLVYIYPENGVTNPPTCHGANGDYYSFSMTRPFAKEYYAILTAAMLAKSMVRMWGTGACTDQGVSETLSYAMVSAP